MRAARIQRLPREALLSVPVAGRRPREPCRTPAITKHRPIRSAIPERPFAEDRAPITPSDNSCHRERHLSLVMATAAICNIVLAAGKRAIVIRFLGKADVFEAE